MRRLLIMILALSISIVFAKEKGKSLLELQPIEEVLLLTDVTPDVAKGLIEGRLPNLAIECHENMNLPLAFAFKTKIFSLRYNPNLTLKIQKSGYFRISHKRKCYFSEDLKNWNTLHPELFDTTMGICQDPPRVVVEIEQNDTLQLR
jgi:hypothetical protein